MSTFDRAEFLFRTPLRTVNAGSAFVFLLAFALAAPALDQPPRHDELYHLLAARGLLTVGEPRIGDGFYVRGLEYTYLAALSLRIFGETLPAARLPALLAAAAIPAVLFFWLYRTGRPAAAWFASLSWLSSPFFIEIATFARFYSIQTLAFTIGAILLERARTRAFPISFAHTLTGVATLVFAIHLQPVTLFGVAGLALWLMVDELPKEWTRRRWLRWSFLIALPLFFLLPLLFPDFLASLWMRFRTAEAFNARFRDAIWFYHAWYQLYYPGLWSLTPLLAALALVRAPSLALFTICTFTVPFVLASLAAPKATRYLAFAQPFLFTLWGLALAELGKLAARFLCGLRRPFAIGLLRFPSGYVLFIPALALTMLAQPFWVRTLAFLLGFRLPFEAPTPDWASVAARLRREAATVSVVMGPHDVYNFFYIGRHDITFSPSKYNELRSEPPGPWRYDPRTGRPVLSETRYLERLFSCYPSGMFVIMTSYLDKSFALPPSAREFLERNTVRLPLPAASGVTAFVWRHEPAVPADSFCSDLHTHSRLAVEGR